MNSNNGLSPSRIVCAAIRAADGEILLGIRHYSPDMHRQIDARPDGEKFHHRHDADQGFVDQHGNYFTREQAWQIAYRNQQVIRRVGDDDGCLYSENLY